MLRSERSGVSLHVPFTLVTRDKVLAQALQLEAEGMPGPWLSASADPEAWSSYSLAEGDYIEFGAYDTLNVKQGTVLCRIDKLEDRTKNGQWTEVTVLAVSDDHLLWWMEYGGGKQTRTARTRARLPLRPFQTRAARRPHGPQSRLVEEEQVQEVCRRGGGEDGGTTSHGEGLGVPRGRGWTGL